MTSDRHNTYAHSAEADVARTSRQSRASRTACWAPPGGVYQRGQAMRSATLPYRRREAYPSYWVGAHATPGPTGLVKEAGMWVSSVAARRVLVGGLLAVLAWIRLEVARFLLAALLLD